MKGGKKGTKQETNKKNILDGNGIGKTKLYVYVQVRVDIVVLRECAWTFFAWCIHVLILAACVHWRIVCTFGCGQEHRTRVRVSTDEIAFIHPVPVPIVPTKCHNLIFASSRLSVRVLSMNLLEKDCFKHSLETRLIGSWLPLHICAPLSPSLSHMCARALFRLLACGVRGSANETSLHFYINGREELDSNKQLKWTIPKHVHFNYVCFYAKLKWERAREREIGVFNANIVTSIPYCPSVIRFLISSLFLGRVHTQTHTHTLEIAHEFGISWPLGEYACSVYSVHSIFGSRSRCVYVRLFVTGICDKYYSVGSRIFVHASVATTIMLLTHIGPELHRDAAHRSHALWL